MSEMTLDWLISLIAMTKVASNVPTLQLIKLIITSMVDRLKDTYHQVRKIFINLRFLKLIFLLCIIKQKQIPVLQEIAYGTIPQNTLNRKRTKGGL